MSLKLKTWFACVLIMYRYILNIVFQEKKTLLKRPCSFQLWHFCYTPARELFNGFSVSGILEEWGSCDKENPYNLQISELFEYSWNIKEKRRAKQICPVQFSYLFKWSFDKKIHMSSLWSENNRFGFDMILPFVVSKIY